MIDKNLRTISFCVTLSLSRYHLFKEYPKTQLEPSLDDSFSSIQISKVTHIPWIPRFPTMCSTKIHWIFDSLQPRKLLIQPMVTGRVY